MRFLMMIWRFVKRVFDGTKECHAKADEAVARSAALRERAKIVAPECVEEEPAHHGA